jgi:hypothetical protein
MTWRGISTLLMEEMVENLEIRNRLIAFQHLPSDGVV